MPPAVRDFVTGSCQNLNKIYVLLVNMQLLIPASILVCRKDAVGRKLSEFDGIIIHPMRKEQQVIFLEAKNRDRKPSFGKNCLVGKFGNFSFEYVADDIMIVDYDAYWKYSIR